MPTNPAIPNISCPFNLTGFVKNCRDALIVKNPTPFKYPPQLSGNAASTESWAKNAKEVKKLNSELLDKLRNNANLYAIYTRQNATDEWDPVYVGHSQGVGMRSRLTAHLIKKDKRTGAMVAKVAEAVRNGAEIAVSFIKIEPEELRLVAENKILGNDKAENEFQWNRNGRAA